ncbi:NAD(P)-dependent oxidoreductase [Periweissella beninensis]|uniref:Phosphoglycerate dehydrogenase n=1 Tax=Periweissella beninensis TaxID=504936 RepID=A0ABT0VJA5_9LACO|nr:NAD(P)-dependent oxidoreductase [Periweissella beninensis]MBM7544371.1 phosphoglycerate dehydrogenase-like enzyme [Periweissella beninensis]MCM2437746.1 phosphoglycerate dehydrogenase [Periweissella beninensis]MCT4395954.1 phosphoglycerate dehydrogenase [Periweissella beninensis]
MNEHIVSFVELDKPVINFINSHNLKLTLAKDLSPLNYATVTIMLGWDKHLSEKILNAPNSQLKWIQTRSAGVDYLPISTLNKRNITVTNASGVHAQPIAQSVMADLLYFTRGLNQHVKNTNNHEWQANGNHFVLSDFTILIFGTGRIGQELAQNLQVFGVKTLGVNHHGNPIKGFNEVFSLENYPQALKKANIIINILPGTTETHHFYDPKFFAKITDLFLFINVGRGASVDSDALLKAIAQHKIKYVALDVTELEPLPIDDKLWQIPEILITSHSTGLSYDYDQRLSKIILSNLTSYFTDKTFVRNVVDLKKGY